MKTSEYKLEKNIPVSRIMRPHRYVYPFNEMEVGDSFVFPEEIRGKVSSAMLQYEKRENKKFTIRRITEGNCRCWRIE